MCRTRERCIILARAWIAAALRLCYAIQDFPLPGSTRLAMLRGPRLTSKDARISSLRNRI